MGKTNKKYILLENVLWLFGKIDKKNSKRTLLSAFRWQCLRRVADSSILSPPCSGDLKQNFFLRDWKELQKIHSAQFFWLFNKKSHQFCFVYFLLEYCPILKPCKCFWFQFNATVVFALSFIYYSFVTVAFITFWFVFQSRLNWDKPSLKIREEK